MTGSIEQALSTVVDPEVGINVVDMGLIYDIDYQGDQVIVTMTLTSPACPMGTQVKEDCEEAIRQAVGDQVNIRIDVVWEPEWTPDRMSAHARRQLGVE